MTVKTSRQEAKREQIRAAARRLFLVHGFSETSMDAVTATAGVSKQTLYRYYETKAQLFAEVLRELITEPVARAERWPPEGPVPRNGEELEAWLVRFGEGYLARMMEPDQLSLLRVIIAEGSRFPELVYEWRSSLPSLGVAAFVAQIEACQAAAVVASWLDTRTVARLFAGLLFGFLMRDGLLAPEPRPPARRQLAEMVHIFVVGIKGPAGTGHPGGVS